MSTCRKGAARAEGLEPPPPIVIDTREQTPWTFNKGLVVERFGMAFPTQVDTLDTGDYAVRGLEDRARIERKTLEDFVRSVTAERERFWRELERLAAFPVRAVVIEGSIREVETLGTTRCRLRSQASPQSVIGSATAIWADFGIPVCWAGHRALAEYTAAWALRRVWLRHLKEKEEA
jgi:DNA excision repair protein ERCC-4